MENPFHILGLFFVVHVDSDTILYSGARQPLSRPRHIFMGCGASTASASTTVGVALLQEGEGGLAAANAGVPTGEQRTPPRQVSQGGAHGGDEGAALGASKALPTSPLGSVSDLGNGGSLTPSSSPKGASPASGSNSFSGGGDPSAVGAGTDALMLRKELQTARGQHRSSLQVRLGVELNFGSDNI